MIGTIKIAELLPNPLPGPIWAESVRRFLALYGSLLCRSRLPAVAMLLCL
jgi:hypothetical protein